MQGCKNPKTQVCKSMHRFNSNSISPRALVSGVADYKIGLGELIHRTRLIIIFTIFIFIPNLISNSIYWVVMLYIHVCFNIFLT
jgi:hypothetical protein